MQSEAEGLVSEYKRAEAAIKDTERRLDSLCIPSLNELRGALFHLLKPDASGTLMSHEGVEAAIRHCKRAYYDAREMETAALCTASADILTSISGHASAVTQVFPQYRDLRKAAIESKEVLSTADDVRAGDTRDKQFEMFDHHRETLRNLIKEYEICRDDIQKAIRNDVIKNVAILIGMIAALAAILKAILSFT